MTTAALQMNRTIWAGAGRAAMLPLGILLLVVLMVVPIAPFLLDMFFILNIMIALAVLMVSLNTQKPLDFSSFPTVLLFATLLRLALNVASTRVVLVNGHTGPDAAGRSEEHTSELQSLMRTSYAVFCLQKKKSQITKSSHKTR